MTSDALVREWLASGKMPSACKVLKSYYCLGKSESCGVKEMSGAYVCGSSIFRSQYHRRLNLLKNEKGGEL